MSKEEVVDTQLLVAFLHVQENVWAVCSLLKRVIISVSFVQNKDFLTLVKE